MPTDSERLDWVEKRGASVECRSNGFTNPWFHILTDDVGPMGHGDTLREAIDTAMLIDREA